MVPEDAQVRVFIDGVPQRFNNYVIEGRHLVQSMCPDQSIIGAWMEFGDIPDFGCICGEEFCFGESYDMEATASAFTHMTFGEELIQGETTVIDMDSFGTAAIVNFASSPSESIIQIGDEIVCLATPCSVELPHGDHHITYRHSRYDAFEQDLSISGDTSFEAELVPRFGWLTVDVIPVGMEIQVSRVNENRGAEQSQVEEGEIAGEPALFTGIELQTMEIDVGTYEVTVENDCYSLSGHRVMIEPAEEQRLSLEPPFREAGVDIRAFDAAGNAFRANVYADGQLAGQAPGRLAVPVCTTEFRVESQEGGLWWAGSLELSADNVSNHQVLIAPSGFGRAMSPKAYTWGMRGGIATAIVGAGSLAYAQMLSAELRYEANAETADNLFKAGQAATYSGLGAMGVGSMVLASTLLRGHW
jgi:hypothetical protein